MLERLNQYLHKLQSSFSEVYLFEIPLPPIGDPLGGLNALIRQGRLIRRPDLTVAKRTAVACCDACTSLCKPVYDLTKNSRSVPTPYSWSVPSPATPKIPALPQALIDSFDKDQLRLLMSGTSEGLPVMRSALEQLAAAS